MIGSISKIRPCAHHHYKYSHAKNDNDLKNVNENYSKDLTKDGEWTWNIDNLNSNTAFRNNTNLKSFVAEIPSTTNAYFFFQNCSNLTNVQMETSHLTDARGLFYGCKISDLPENFCPNITNFGESFRYNYPQKSVVDENKTIILTPYSDSINNATSAGGGFYFNGNSVKNGYKIDERYKFENLSYGESLFRNDWHGGIGLYGDVTLNLINLTNGSYMFCGGENLRSFTSPLPKLTNGSHMFYRANATLGASFVFNSELPSLSNGENMFAQCWLDKASTLKVCNSIPTYEDGSTHKLTLGIAVDHKYDPEVNLALKKVDMDFVSPIESIGGTLSEEVTSDKGWTLATQWNGTISGNEYLNPIMISKLELDTIVLPVGYMRCEYLEATGTQYIDTEYIPTNTTGIWNIAKSLVNYDSASVGVRSDNIYVYPPRWVISFDSFYGWGNATNMSVRGNGMCFESSVNYINDRKALLTTNGNVNYSYDLNVLTTPPTHSLYIFGRNGNGTLEREWKGRIYRVQISEGEEIVRDYIPCLDAFGVPCMYDMIQGKTYYNVSETDSFLYKTYDNYVIQEGNPYDIIEGSNYIPDASSWNSIAYADLTEKGKQIVRVVDGIAYDA